MLEVFPEANVTAAALDAICLGAISFDAVKQLVIAKLERRPANLDLSTYPYLPRASVKTTVAADYMVLLEGRAHDSFAPKRQSGSAASAARSSFAAAQIADFLREYDKVAVEAAREGLDHLRYLLRLAELELIDRERRMVERRIRAAHFPAVKSFDTFDFAAIPSLNKPLVLELARCEYMIARDKFIALGNSGTGKTHVALRLGSPLAREASPSPSSPRPASSIN